MSKSYLTTSDFFCGAGGSSSGAKQAGFEVSEAANHSKLAIETHNTNHPNTDHYLLDLMEANPLEFPHTDNLWASPECRKHKPLKDRAREGRNQLNMFTKYEPSPDDIRSRANAWTVCKFAKVHNYKTIIVENIIEFRAYWEDWDKWLKEMDKLGYHNQPVYFNSMFFNPLNGCTHFAPQSRDRIYVVFWKKGHPKPDLDFRPWAWCYRCEKNIQAIQSWKSPKKKWGVYGKRGQYWYRCPGCTEIVDPYYYAALNVIDWSLPMTKIGERQTSLKPNTLKRIQAGIEKYGNQLLQVRLAYNFKNGNEAKFTRTMNDPFFSITTAQEMAFVSNGLQVHLAYPDSNNPLNRVRSTYDPFFSLTTQQEIAFVTSYYTRNSANSGIGEPLPTVTPENRHGLISFLINNRGDSRYTNALPLDGPLPVLTTTNAPWLVEFRKNMDARGIDKPLSVITTEGCHHGVIAPAPFISTYNNNSTLRHVGEALPAITTVDTAALTIPDEIDINECYFRMFDPAENKLGMGFDKDYILLGNKREQNKLAGNAVTPPVSEWLYQRIGETYR